jgi:hypothetical protein
MRICSIVITVLMLSSFMVSAIILSQPFGRCDPVGPSLTGVDIEGAHILSEGAYFRFWIFNNNSFSITVTVNGKDTLSVPAEGWVDYDVIAPHISVPYEQVTYRFLLQGADSPPKNVDFTVLLLNSTFAQIFDLAVPILVIIAAIVVALATIIVIRRIRGRSKPDA